MSETTPKHFYRESPTGQRFDLSKSSLVVTEAFMPQIRK